MRHRPGKAMARAIAITVAGSRDDSIGDDRGVMRRNTFGFKRLPMTTRRALRPTRAAGQRRRCWCPETWATRRATPRFLARLDRRVAALAAGLSSGVALPVAQAVSYARHDA